MIFLVVSSKCFRGRWRDPLGLRSDGHPPTHLLIDDPTMLGGIDPPVRLHSKTTVDHEAGGGESRCQFSRKLARD